MRGRKPVAAEERRRRGEPGRPMPVVVGGRIAPSMPPHLSPEMQEAWTFIVEDLTRADSIDHADAGAYEAAAVAWGRAREARAQMVGVALVIETKQGAYPHPLLAIEDRAWKAFAAWAERMPLSPWGRARLGLKSKVPADQVEKDIGLPPRLRVVNDGQ